MTAFSPWRKSGFFVIRFANIFINFYRKETCKVNKKFLIIFSILALLLVPFSNLSPTYAVSYDVEDGYKTLEARFWLDENPPVGFYINATAKYILETVDAPKMGSTYGEWSVMDLLRGMYTGYDYMNYIPPTYFDDYLTRIEGYVQSKKGVLDRNKSTEWSRLILALTALGYDITDVKGNDFIKTLSESHKFSYKQGINGPIWELIALNTGKYELYPNTTNPDVNTKGKMIDYILGKEITTVNNVLGGWALSGAVPDPDITGMALQALAPYYLDETAYRKTGATTSYEEFLKAVERGIVALNQLQLPNGGFDSWGSINSESTVQVIVALTALHFDPLASTITLPHIQKTVSFITDGVIQDGVWTNNMLDALLTFWAAKSGKTPSVGGFKHITTGYDGGGGSGVTVNAMATDQALYGLIAYDRYKKGLNSLYDMTDMSNGQYKKMKAQSYKVNFITDGRVETKNYSPYAEIIIPSPSNSYSSWNSNADGSGTKYVSGEILIMPEHEITLYAIAKEDEIDQAAVDLVIEQISKLPTIEGLTIEHANQIELAKAQYNRLTSKEKTAVTNASKLFELEIQIGILLTKYDSDLKVETLIRAIDSLSKLPEVTGDYEIAIQQARIAYENMTAEERLKVTNIYELEIVEAKLALWKKAQAQMEQELNSAEQVKLAIDALPKLEHITLAHLQPIREIRVLYNSLPEHSKNLISNYEYFLQIESRVEQLYKDSLIQEDIEDEIQEDSYSEINVEDGTLIIQASKSTRDFAISIDMDTLKNYISSNDIEFIKFIDQRKVAITINKNELLKQLGNKKGLLMVSVSQLDANTNSFKFSIDVKELNGKNSAINLERSYATVEIPLTFYKTGFNLAEKVVMKQNKTAVPHVIKNNQLTLYARTSTTFEFSNSTTSFSDVEGRQLANEVYYLTSRKVINGTSSTTYSPTKGITRAQFAALISRALDLQRLSNFEFKDTVNDRLKLDISKAYDNGLINGMSNTTYAPNGIVTREQAAVMMVNILKYAGYPVESVKPVLGYKDTNKISSWASKEVGILTALNIMEGYNNTFNPKQPLTREQMAKILKITLNTAEML